MTDTIVSLPYKAPVFTRDGGPKTNLSPHSRRLLFNNDILQIDWLALLAQIGNDPNKQFSTFYNRLNKLVNKHAILKRLSKTKSKQFKKPWITMGMKIAIRKKNDLFITNKHDKYI